jgi:Protein of unknown function (DUF3579)
MKYIIYGKTVNGQLFRPTDWADRLCGILAHHKENSNDSKKVQSRRGNNTITYSEYLMPTVVDGIRSVALDGRLGDIEPLALNFVLNFASDNQLVIEKQ